MAPFTTQSKGKERSEPTESKSITAYYQSPAVPSRPATPLAQPRPGTPGQIT